MKYISKLRNHIQNLRIFGIQYELFILSSHIRKYDKWEYLEKNQEFYKQLDKSKYEAALTEWYYRSTGYRLDLENPKRFTEKMQWVKLHASTQEKGYLADKYEVRNWIREKIGEEYLIPLLGVWESVSEIDFDALPDSFVLKCNHGSGMNIIIRDKGKVDLEEIKKKLDLWLSLNYGFCNGAFELHYQYIKPRIIAEALMVDGDKEDLDDYKFCCFNGTPVCCEVIVGRNTDERVNYYDKEWNLQEFVGLCAPGAPYKNTDAPLEKPLEYSKMMELAAVLSEGFPFVRVDFYVINHRIYFGEMTFTPSNCGGRFYPDKYDYIFGDMLTDYRR